MSVTCLDFAEKGYKVEFDVSMPLPKKESFLRKYDSNGWDNEIGEKFVHATRTMALETAKDFYNSLPNYAEIIHVNMFPPGFNATHIYSGPLEVPADAKKRVDILEMKLEMLKRQIKKIEETPIIVKLGVLSKMTRKN